MPPMCPPIGNSSALPEHSSTNTDTLALMQCEYFDSPESLRHMMLHAAPDAARGRGLYALHLPADGRCLVRPLAPHGSLLTHRLLVE